MHANKTMTKITYTYLPILNNLLFIKWNKAQKIIAICRDRSHIIQTATVKSNANTNQCTTRKSVWETVKNNLKKLN